MFCLRPRCQLNALGVVVGVTQTSTAPKICAATTHKILAADHEPTWLEGLQQSQLQVSLRVLKQVLILDCQGLCQDCAELVQACVFVLLLHECHC